MVNGIMVDGVAYNHIHISSLKRDGEVLDGDNAGRVKSGAMQRDIIGTYYNYTCVIDADMSNLSEYDALYEVLTAPVESHVVVMPYAQGTLTFNAYVSSVSDEADLINAGGRWGNMSFKFVAKDPQRR